jgi:hypothetical protein
MSSDPAPMKEPPRAGVVRSSAPQAASLGRAALVSRLIATHLACYPMMFVAAAAGMSLSIIANEGALLQAAETTEPTGGIQGWLISEVGLGVVEAASFEIIMRPVLVVLLVVFLISHAASLPWALAARRAALTDDWGGVAVKRARLRWMGASLGSTALVVVAGAVGWLIILLS